MRNILLLTFALILIFSCKQNPENIEVEEIKSVCDAIEVLDDLNEKMIEMHENHPRKTVADTPDEERKKIKAEIRRIEDKANEIEKHLKKYFSKEEIKKAMEVDCKEKYQNLQSRVKYRHKID